MKFTFFLRCALFCAIFCIGSRAASAMPDVNENVKCSVADPIWGSGTLQGYGTIEKAGDIYISMNIVNGKVTGKYYYAKVNTNKKKKTWIPVKGIADWNDFTITLRENNGSFIGQLLRIDGGYLYEGTFVRDDGRRFEFSIELHYK